MSKLNDFTPSPVLVTSQGQTSEFDSSPDIPGQSKYAEQVFEEDEMTFPHKIYLLSSFLDTEVQENLKFVTKNGKYCLLEDTSRSHSPYLFRTGIKELADLFPKEQSWLPIAPSKLRFIRSGLDFILQEDLPLDGLHFHATYQSTDHNIYREYVYALFYNDTPVYTDYDFSAALNFNSISVLRAEDLPYPNWYSRGMLKDIVNKIYKQYRIVETEKQFLVCSPGENDASPDDLLNQIRFAVQMGSFPSETEEKYVLLKDLQRENFGYTCKWPKYMFNQIVSYVVYSRNQVYSILRELSNQPTWPWIQGELSIKRKDMVFILKFVSDYLPDIIRVENCRKFIGSYVPDLKLNWVAFDNSKENNEVSWYSVPLPGGLQARINSQHVPPSPQVRSDEEFEPKEENIRRVRRQVV